MLTDTNTTAITTTAAPTTDDGPGNLTAELPISDGINSPAAAAACSARAEGTSEHLRQLTTPASRSWRDQSLAAKAVAHWAASVREVGREPLYSTSWGNAASRSVARQLGLIEYGHTLHVT